MEHPSCALSPDAFTAVCESLCGALCASGLAWRWVAAPLQPPRRVSLPCGWLESTVPHCLPLVTHAHHLDPEHRQLPSSGDAQSANDPLALPHSGAGAPSHAYMFTIVLHSVYRVPTLLLRGCTADGEMLSAADVLADLASTPGGALAVGETSHAALGPAGALLGPYDHPGTNEARTSFKHARARC